MAHPHMGFLIIVLEILQKDFLLHGFSLQICLFVRLAVEDEILIIVLDDELWVDLHL